MNPDYMDRNDLLDELDTLRVQYESLQDEMAAALDLIEDQRAEREDAARFAKLVAHFTSCKWTDSVLSSLKPEDEKCITPEGLRAAIDRLKDKS